MPCDSAQARLIVLIPPFWLVRLNITPHLRHFCRATSHPLHFGPLFEYLSAIEIRVLFRLCCFGNNHPRS